MYKKTQTKKKLNFCLITPLSSLRRAFIVSLRPARAHSWYLFFYLMSSAANQSLVLVYVTPQKTCHKQVLFPCEVHLNKIQLFLLSTACNKSVSKIRIFAIWEGCLRAITCLTRELCLSRVFCSISTNRRVLFETKQYIWAVIRPLIMPYF